MIWFAFASALTLQTAYDQAAATPETYQAPVVRPFEPPSDFGREDAQGDADETVHRRPLTQAVRVGAYVGSYETSPTDGEIAYDQGVAQAEINLDGRMGPLDGRWRVSDEAGRPLLSLVLTDRGEGRMVEGGWRRLEPHAASAADGVAGPAARQDGVVVVPLDGGTLRLHPAARGFVGTLERGGRRQAVVVSRAG